DGERDLLAREPPDQGLVVHGADAVIDARDAEQIERFPDVARRPLLASVGGEKEARVAGAGEHARELARRISPLGRIEPDADDAVAKRQRRVEGALGVGLVEMAQEAYDQACLYAELSSGISRGAGQAFDHGRERDAA